MKIAVFHNLPSGGAKRALYEQVKRLAQNNIVDTYTFETANHEFCDLRQASNVHKIYSYHSIISSATLRKVILFASRINIFPLPVLLVYFLLPKVHQRISNDIDNEKYDVAYVCPDLLTQAPYLLRYLKTPTVYFCTEPKREFYEHIPRVSKRLTYLLTYVFRYPLKLIDRTNAAAAKVILVNSFFSQSTVKKCYGRNAEVNYPGVDNSLFIDRKLPRQNRVISVGALNLLKGHDFVIRAISLIPKKDRPVLQLVGNGGEDKNFLISLAKTLEVPLEIMENSTDKNIVNYYNTAKVLAYAPLNEPFGLVILEAFACGLQVIGVEEGGAKELKNKFSSIRFLGRIPKLWSNEIQKKMTEYTKYSSNKYDLNTLKNNFSWDRSAYELVKTLQLACQK